MREKGGKAKTEERDWAAVFCYRNSGRAAGGKDTIREEEKNKNKKGDAKKNYKESKKREK